MPLTFHEADSMAGQTSAQVLHGPCAMETTEWKAQKPLGK